MLKVGLMPGSITRSGGWHDLHWPAAAEQPVKAAAKTVLAMQPDMPEPAARWAVGRCPAVR